MNMNRDKLYAQIKQFPKVDLHRHLEGSILPETFVEIARNYGGEHVVYKIFKSVFAI